MSLTSSRLRAFNATVETGSFSGAARRLGISQPSVAQQVRELETGFGVTLFTRRGTGLVPTPTCEALYRATQRLQALENDALAILRQRQDHAAGELRIGLGNAMPGMRLIGAFQRLYPKVRVHVETGSWSGVMDAVAEQRVDLGLLPDVPDDGRFRRQGCLLQRVVAIVHDQHRLARRGEIGWDDLAAEPLIFRAPGSSTQRVVARALRAAGLETRPVMVVDSREAMVEAVANGIGAGFIWEYGTSRIAPIARLSIAGLADGSMEYIFSLRGRHSPLAEAFFGTHPALA
jgi:DNA-binding transcriptional LysR family regulator